MPEVQTANASLRIRSCDDVFKLVLPRIVNTSSERAHTYTWLIYDDIWVGSGLPREIIGVANGAPKRYTGLENIAIFRTNSDEHLMNITDHKSTNRICSVSRGGRASRHSRDLRWANHNILEDCLRSAAGRSARGFVRLWGLLARSAWRFFSNCSMEVFFTLSLYLTALAQIPSTFSSSSVLMKY